MDRTLFEDRLKKRALIKMKRAKVGDSLNMANCRERIIWARIYLES